MKLSNDDWKKVFSSAIINLLKERNRQRNWNDIRSTALATISLIEIQTKLMVLDNELKILSEAIKDAQIWLASQARDEEGGVSWESEAWDTALSLMAISSNDEFTKQIDQGAAWLQRIKDPLTGVWYDEIWETILSTIALLRVEKFRKKSPYSHGAWLKEVLKWFCEIPSKSSGEFINPHYSGFIVWLLGEIKANKLLQNDLKNSSILKKFIDKANTSADYLLSKVSKINKFPWSWYTFSNSYISYGLSVYLNNLDSKSIDFNFADLLVKWLKKHQGDSGGFEDNEDTALAILALVSIIEPDEQEEKRLAQQILPLLKNSNTSLNYFLGYSIKSDSIALKLKDFLREMEPKLQPKDWQWTFKPGHIIFKEIEKTSKDCLFSIFLVTKDDKLIKPSGASVTIPSDNIIFEIGYFAGTIGIEKTIIIYEKGSKIPTDLSGIIWIEIKDRRNLGDVKIKLLKKIKELLVK